MDNRIKEYIESGRERFVSDLGRLVNVRSVREAPLDGMPFGRGCADALAEAVKIASEHGFMMENMENYAGEISFGPSPELMLLAHLDVVSEGDGWTYQPYEMTAEGGRLYGRGTTDDKGAALACLYALKAVKELYGEPETGVRLVLGCGEETGSEDMEYYFSKREKLEYTLSPDADYPIINLEKGRFAPEFTFEADGGDIIEINGGAVANIVPGKADVLIRGSLTKELYAVMDKISAETKAEFTAKEENGCVRIFCTGATAHAATPEKGNNANTAVIALLTDLPLNTSLKEPLEKLKAFVPHGDTKGKGIGVEMSDEISGALSFNFGILSFDGKTLRGGFDLRCPLCANETNVKEVIREKLYSAGFVFDGDPGMRKVHYVPADAPIIKEALKVYEEYTGRKGECLSTGGGTYVHGIEGGAAFGIEFGGTDYRIHGADEFAVTDELLLTAEMYAQIIKDLCYGKDPV